MNAPDSNSLTPPQSSGAWRGVAGCFVTAAMTVFGGVIGGLVGWKLMPPDWDRMGGGSEFHGLSVLFEQLAWLIGGTLVGILLGSAIGVVTSIMLFRRR